MFDPNLRVLMDVNETVDQLIADLQRYPGDTPVSICGAYTGYIHAEVDDAGDVTGITIDTEPLYENYPDGTFEDEEDDDDE